MKQGVLHYSVEEGWGNGRLLLAWVWHGYGADRVERLISISVSYYSSGRGVVRIFLYSDKGRLQGGASMRRRLTRRAYKGEREARRLVEAAGGLRAALYALGWEASESLGSSFGKRAWMMVTSIADKVGKIEHAAFSMAASEGRGRKAASRIWKQALEWAVEMMDNEPMLETRSALKEGARNAGIPFGPEMGRFVRWAERELGI